MERLRKSLGAKSKVEVIRRGLRLLSEQTDRDELRRAYREAAMKVRGTAEEDLDELDPLSSEGMDEA